MTHPNLDPTSNNPKVLTRILDSLDALVYVSDMQTHEVLYINAYGRKWWGDLRGRKCYELQNQDGPCTFCTNQRLVNDRGQSTGPQVWEIKNATNQRWYQCRDQAIPWTGGHLAKLVIATDITNLKNAETKLKTATKAAKDLAHTDELTRLYNRRAFFMLGSQVLNPALRAPNQPASLVMFDLDYFKCINDTHGHAVGDQMLVAVSKAIAPLVRKDDVLGRIGGEEFAILMANADLHAAMNLIKRLRNAVNQVKVSTATAAVGCTASFGVSTNKDGNPSLDSLLSNADSAMYQAKAEGRDRISIA